MRGKLNDVWCLDPVNSPELISRLRRHGVRADFEVVWVGEGWRSLVEQCHHQLESVFPDYELLVIKQKWGVMEFQALPWPKVDGEPSWQEPDYDRLQSITDQFQRRSETVCEWCGAEARLREWRTVELTLCDGCDARFADPPLPPS